MGTENPESGENREKEIEQELEERQARLVKLGAQLRTLREAQKITIAQVAEQTKIQRQYIKSIEDGTIDALPKGPYTRSFHKQYCAYLMADDLWRLYDKLTEDQKVKVPMHEVKEEGVFQTPSPKVFKRHSTWWVYPLVAASLCAAVWLTWNYRADMSSITTSPNSGGTAPIAEAPVSDEQPPEPTVSADAVQSPDTSVDLGWMDGKPAQPTPAPAPAPVSGDQPASPAAAQTLKDNELKVIPLGVVWVKVSQGKSVFFEGIIRVSEDKVYPVSAEEPLRVRYGNPSKSSVQWRGKVTGPLGSGKTPLTQYYWSDGRVTDTK